MGRTWGCALGSQSCPTRHCKLQDLTRRALVSHRPGGRSPRWRRPTARSLPRAVGGSPVRASVAGPRPWRPGPHVRHPHVRSQHRVVSSPRLLSGCRPGPRCDRWGALHTSPRLRERALRTGYRAASSFWGRAAHAPRRGHGGSHGSTRL